MAATVITVDDLTPFAPNIDVGKAGQMIADAMALAAVVAPCITGDDFASPGAAKAIIRRAILRWNEQGGGAVTTVQQGAGPFQQMQTVDTRSQNGRLFWPSEITDLQALCSSGGVGKAFAIDTMPIDGGVPSVGGYWSDTTTWVPG